MDIYEMAENIKTKDDFVNFLVLLRKDFAHDSAEWVNSDLEAFLDGLYGYCTDTQSEGSISWKIVAEILLAAKVYE